MMKAPRCTICHEKPLYPVRFRCFPCSSVNPEKRNCSTLTMVCMHCADRYLELDKKPEERSLTKRCLFCDKTVDPLTLTRDTAYEILHHVMDLDEQTYTCTHMGCFYEGSHLDMLDHSRGECEYRMVQCPECSVAYQAVFEDMHKMTSPCHTTCTVCDEHVPTHRYPQHMEDDHAHYVQCGECNDYVFQFSYGFHMKDKHDARECRYCAKWVCDRHGGTDHLEKCEGIMECPLCEGPFLPPKQVATHFEQHAATTRSLVEKYEGLLQVYKNSPVRDADHVLHTEWIRKVLREKRKEERAVQKFIHKHERWWI